MRLASIIFGLIVFVCVVSVSFSHTVDLYERVGFLRWEAVMITIAVETAFLLSGWSILWYRFRGQSPGGPAYAGFVYGVAIVLFSNSAYTVGLDILFENKAAQWVLALSVVVGVLIAEAIISRNLVRLREQENEQTAEQTDEQTAGQTNETNSAKQGEQTNTEKEQTVKQTNNQTNESNKQDKREQTTPDKQTNSKQTNRQTNEQSGKQTDKQTASTTYGKHANKQTNKQRSKQTQTDNAKVYDEAIRYRKEKGTLPSVRTLASLAGCSNHRAHKVLQELRGKAG